SPSHPSRAGWSRALRAPRRGTPMRALIRMRTLAAACALLLLIAGTAAATRRPSELLPNMPDPEPPMVGDPDDSQGLIVIQLPYGILILRLKTQLALPTPSRSA